MNHKTLPDWGSIADWASLSNGTIAKQIGCSLKQVAYYRRTRKLPYGPRTPGSGLHQKPRGSPKKPARLPLYECRRRLEAIWDLLWPDRTGDPVDENERSSIEWLLRSNFPLPAVKI